MSARIRFRPHITKKTHVVFFCPARALNFCRFPKKQIILGDGKKSEKNKFISGYKKNIFPTMFFFCLCFLVALFNSIWNRSKDIFISSPSLTWLTFQEICQMFFYFVALINFSKNRFKQFFLNVFLPPSLIRFWFFSDLKQRSRIWAKQSFTNRSVIILMILEDL